ncbi:arginase [Thermococcus profundus]|uniref:Arginase n=1 Tax=Thermococcus profundus TaxID=49899 RepID=A0A2Z2MEL5_THEPR|nr:arginase family protein [Thermococcus profundus]ASJ03095.1 arginase [Thermococcus profundus]
MVTFIPFGEKPNREGVEYALRLLLREGLIDEGEVRKLEARNVAQLKDKLERDCCYIVGEHLATYAVVEKLRPEAVLSVDAHTDLLHDYLDHGSWLAYALEERILERAGVVGPVLMIPTSRRTDLWTRRVRIYPALPRTKKVRGKWKTYINLTNHGVDGVLDDARRYLGEEIYLTVDLDVLRPEYRIARFQHGELTLDELLEVVEGIRKRFRITAFDLAEVSDRIKRSKLGREALIEVFSVLRG